MDYESNLIIFKNFNTLSAHDINDWIKLFEKCFQKNSLEAEKVLKKYRTDPLNSVFCFAIINSEIVASYSGLIKELCGNKIFVSTDTMSNGDFKDATVKMANELYPYLKSIGVKCVCGFPNDNIINIRVRKLKWKIISSLSPYIGIPFLWRIFKNSENFKYILWYIPRPKNGYFTTVKKFIRILGRDNLYEGSYFSFVFTLSTKSPGVFFIRLPNFIAKQKKFGYVILGDENQSISINIIEASKYLDINCIDVP